MSGGGSFTTLPLTRHSSTNINIIRRFLPVTVDVTREDAHRCRVQISGAGAS
jgi:RNA 3'-terminal phosphate cyclase